MSPDWIYFQAGLQHILNASALDHILFLIAICAVYRIRQWKTVAMLVTAFTAGHCLTLAISVYFVPLFSAATAELLIPLTILGSSIANLIPGFSPESGKKRLLLYCITGTFGMIHGMGFASNFLAMPLGEDPLWKQLLLFNFGVEAGQLTVVAMILAVAWFSLDFLKIPLRIWTIGASVFTGVFSLFLLFRNEFW